MLAHRLRRWPNTDSTPGELPVPAGMCQKEGERKVFHAWRHRGQRQTVTHVQELSILYSPGGRSIYLTLLVNKVFQLFLA